MCKTQLAPLPSHILSPLILPLNFTVLVHVAHSNYPQPSPQHHHRPAPLGPGWVKHLFTFLLVPEGMTEISYLSSLWHLTSSESSFPWPFKARAYKCCFSLSSGSLTRYSSLHLLFFLSHPTPRLVIFNHFKFFSLPLSAISLEFFPYILPSRSVIFKF